MSIERDQVCILIPTLNEAPTIGALVREFFSLGFRNILVIDGHSSDGTRTIAAQAGARVVEQEGRGKGAALIEAFSLIEDPYILLIDGDGTYSPGDADRLLAPLASGSSHVIGNRLTEENRKAFSRLNFTGNQILNRLFKLAHGRFLTDILSGYRAFTRESVKQMRLKESGFGIETELSAEAIRCNLEITVVPISYSLRSGTPTKLNPFHDGLKITSTIYRLAKLSNPLFYFGIIGVIIMVAGFISGAYVLAEWLRHIEHIPLTILTVLLIVVGFQVFMFGIISDLLLAFHREVMNEIHEARREKEKE